MSQRFETFTSNVRALVFLLYRKGIKSLWNVSGATQIRLEVTTPAGVDLSPILCSPTHPDADWTNGKVVAVIDTGNVTGALGTYLFALTVDIAGERVTAEDGVIEVLPKPGID